MRINFKNNYFKSDKGMTLIELVVVLAIFAVISSITIFNYGGFKSNNSMQNLADDIALSVRKAQSYATGAHGVSSQFTYGYGVHFTANPFPSSAITGSNKSFIFFTDISGNKIYNYSTINGSVCGVGIDASNECTELLNITSTDRISAIYLNNEPAISPSASVDILFLRPNMDAYFCYKSVEDSALPCERSTDISRVRIEVSNDLNDSTGGKTKIISIWNTGQISVE